MKLNPFVQTWACFLVLLFVITGCASDELTRTQDPTEAGTAVAGQEPASTQEQDEKIDTALLEPLKANKQAPDKFKVKFATTQGDFVVEVDRSWAPNGADRLYNLVDIGYFKDIVIFRGIPGFMFQFGVHGNPTVAQTWQKANIKDDKFVGNSNLPYTLTFAQAGFRNSRSTQFFINLGNNARLDTQPNPFVPIGKVVEGKSVVDKINTEYGENDRSDQQDFVEKGNDFILKKYPRLDIIKSASIMEDGAGDEESGDEGDGQ